MNRLLFPPLLITKKRLPFGNLLLLLERAMGLALPLRSRSAFRLTGVLPSASRPCRPYFFVAPHPATPNNKKRLPFGNLLLLLERAMGFGPTTSTLARLRSTPELYPHHLRTGYLLPHLKIKCKNFFHFFAKKIFSVLGCL